jgi:hypothetical protein
MSQVYEEQSAAGPQPEHPSAERARDPVTPWQSHRTKGLEQADPATPYGGEAARSRQTRHLLRFPYRSSDAAEDGDSGRGVGGGFRSSAPPVRPRARPVLSKMWTGAVPWASPVSLGHRAVERTALGCNEVQGGSWASLLGVGRGSWSVLRSGQEPVEAPYPRPCSSAAPGTR